MNIVNGNGSRHSASVTERQLESIENLLREVTAKQDLLLGHINELKNQQINTRSEMKSNYVANEGMFTEILEILESIIKAQACQVTSLAVPDRIRTREPLARHS